MLAKAPSLKADEVIVDLEDAVAAEEKERAREFAVAALRRGPLGRTTALRVNARWTPWWEDDLRAAAEARPDVVVLPKVESPEDVSAAAVSFSKARRSRRRSSLSVRRSGPQDSVRRTSS